MNNHRKIYEKEYGTIPKDQEGRSYEIHHIDGNRKNNNIENLTLVTIQEHYDIHFSQRDFGACTLIAKRMNMSPEYISNIQKGIKRPGIGGVKKGTVPWNKGLSGVINISNELRYIRKINATGENNPRSKLTEDQVYDIIQLYLQKVEIGGVNIKEKNGKVNSYDWAFSKELSKQYNVTSTAINRIIKQKSWDYVWKKFKEY
jgi:hypothetical protein